MENPEEGSCISTPARKCHVTVSTGPHCCKRVSLSYQAQACQKGKWRSPKRTSEEQSKCPISAVCVRRMDIPTDNKSGGVRLLFKKKEKELQGLVGKETASAPNLRRNQFHTAIIQGNGAAGMTWTFILLFKI